MKICLAQINPEIGNCSANIQNHIKWIEQAVDQQANLIIFPELSLTGYEPKFAKSLAMDPSDSQLKTFQILSDINDIVIAIGVPLKSERGITISMIFFHPYQPQQIYSKQTLHSDEEPYFVPGTEQLVVDMNNIKIAPAICYESLLEEHFQKAKQLGAVVYLASVAKPQTGIEKAFAHFPVISARHSMPILMVNSIGFCDDFESAGQSAVWDKQGVLVKQLNHNEEGLLFFDV